MEFEISISILPPLFLLPFVVLLYCVLPVLLPVQVFTTLLRLGFGSKHFGEF